MKDASSCLACGAVNKPGRQYCCSCGVGLGCPGCGFINDPDDTFCGGCGRQLLGEVQTDDPELTPVRAGCILGFELDELRAEAGIETHGDLTPSLGHPVHMDQAELDDLFGQDGR